MKFTNINTQKFIIRFRTNLRLLTDGAKIGSQKGLIEADEAAMIFKVFQLNDLKAKDLMIPRVSAPCIDGSSNLDEISKLIMSDTSPWWVILGDKVDKIQGVVERESMLAELIKGGIKIIIRNLRTCGLHSRND